MMQRPGIQKHHGGYPPSASSVMGMVHHPPAILHPAHAMGSGGPPSMPSMTSHHSGSLARSGHRHHHHGHPHEGPSAWQTSLSDIHQAGGGSISHRGPSANPALVIPRAKVKRSSVERGSHVGGGYTNAGYHSDDDVISQDEVSLECCFYSRIKGKVISLIITRTLLVYIFLPSFVFLTNDILHC